MCYNTKVGSSSAKQKSGCGAAGSALPWGGRGRKFKSCHSDQNRAFFGMLDFFLFYAGFQAFLVLKISLKTRMVPPPKTAIFPLGTTLSTTVFQYHLF